MYDTVEFRSTVRSFTPGARVFGRAPKLPIGAIASPHFKDFTNPNASPLYAYTRCFSEIGPAVQQDSLEIGPKENLALRSSSQELETGEFLLCQTGYFYQNNGINKVDSKWNGQGVIIGMFGYKFDLSHRRDNTIETYLHYLRSKNKILGILCFDGTLHLRWGNTKSTVRYLVDRQALVCLTKIRNGF